SRVRPASSLRVHRIAEPNAASPTDQVMASPNHSPASRRRSSSPATTQATASTCRVPPGGASIGRPSVVDGGSSEAISHPNRYSTAPNPAANDRTTKASRMTVGSTSRRSAMPPATPATTRFVRLRRNGARRAWTMGSFVSRMDELLGGSWRCSHTGCTAAMGFLPQRGQRRLRVFPGASPMARACRSRMIGLMDTNSNLSSTGTAPGTPGPTAGPTTTRRLVRRKDQRMIAGVAAGLGDYFDVDPVWFRLGFVVSAFLGGAGIILYGAMWLLLPSVEGPVPGQPPLPPRMERMVRRIDRTPGWVGVILLLLGVLLLANRIVAWRPGIFWGVVLVAIGVLLFRRPVSARRRGAEVPSSPPPSPSLIADVGPSLDQPTSGVSPEPTQGTPVEPAAIATAPPPPKEVFEAPRQRERSSLGWMVVGAVLLALGVAALLDVANAIRMSLVQYLAVALALIGVGLLTGAFVGRARWLVVPGLLLIPFLLVASLIEVPVA